MNRIEEIKERWRKATPGPWLNRGNFVATSEAAYYGYPPRDGVICGLDDGEYIENENCENDVEAIAKAPEDIEYLLSKLEIAEKALEALEESNILAAVDVNLIEIGYQFATGTELMIHDSRLRSIEKGNRAKALAKESLKQIRE